MITLKKTASTLAIAATAAIAFIKLPIIFADTASAVIFTADREKVGDIPVDSTEPRGFSAGPGAEVVIVSDSSLAAVGTAPPPVRIRTSGFGLKNYTIGRGTYVVRFHNRPYRFTNE